MTLLGPTLRRRPEPRSYQAIAVAYAAVSCVWRLFAIAEHRGQGHEASLRSTGRHRASDLETLHSGSRHTQAADKIADFVEGLG
jgi:hypothetical protein